MLGRTKPGRYIHSKRWWPRATGRQSRGAHTRRSIGFSPTRRSSTAHTSKGSVRLLLLECLYTAAELRLEDFLRQGIGFGVAGARHLPDKAEPAQIVGPAPGGRQDARACRQSTGRPRAPSTNRGQRRIVQAIPQAALVACIEQRSGAGVELALVAQPRNPGLVIACHANANPARRVPRHLGHELRRASAPSHPSRPCTADAVHRPQGDEPGEPCCPCQIRWIGPASTEAFKRRWYQRFAAAALMPRQRLR